MTHSLKLKQTVSYRVRQASLMQKRFGPLALYLLFFPGMALIQFATPDMPDTDRFSLIKLAGPRYACG
ncbi:MAG TPA: hypothetical protein VIR02_18750 [Anaerolineales bacterium]